VSASISNMLFIFGCALVLGACGGDESVERAQELGEQGEAAIADMESAYGAGEELLVEAPDTEVNIEFGGHSNDTFSKVYRYQANVADRSTFIWMTLDNNDMDDQHIAVTVQLNGINEVGEYTLDRQRNGNIYIEMDQIAFRTDAGNATVKLTSTSGDYLEGSFSATNVARNQNRGDEVIEIKDARFKLPLNDMRRSP